MESTSHNVLLIAVLCFILAVVQILRSMDVIGTYFGAVSRIESFGDMPADLHTSNFQAKGLADGSYTKQDLTKASKRKTTSKRDSRNISASTYSQSSLSSFEYPQSIESFRKGSKVEHYQVNLSKLSFSSGKLPTDVSKANFLINPPPTNRKINACLFIMDDTIRLVEWLAYHYTVLPLGHLLVAVDPKSKRVENIRNILNLWKDYISIEAFYNDTFMDIDEYEGWGRPLWGPNNRLRGWFKNKNGFTYRSQAHKRRQNYFTGYCFGELYEKNKEWTILTDTDEFITFNYRYPDTEDSTKFGSETRYTTKEDVEQERLENIPLRDMFAHMPKRTTIAQYLNVYEKHQRDNPKKCIRIPGLTFTSHESNRSTIEQDLPEGKDGYLLMTLRQRKHAAKDGIFSKAILNLRTAAGKDWFRLGTVLNVHTPNRQMCGKSMKENFSGSGADYISSLFRIHHYKAGTVESYLERAGDWRGGSLWRFYYDRNVEPVGENNDLTHWFRWFVDKVGEKAANELLILPLKSSYAEIGNLSQIKDAKKKIAKLVPNLLGNSTSVELTQPKYYIRTNHTIGACMYISDQTLRLMEWIAYHYTILPLSHLILEIDPNSVRHDKLRNIAQNWRSLVDIELWFNKTLEKNSTRFSLGIESQQHNSESLEHRKNTFFIQCLRTMKRSGHDYIFFSDSDELAAFNYIKNDKSPIGDRLNKDPAYGIQNSVDEALHLHLWEIRNRLPPLEEHVTIADFLHGEKKEKCYFLPSLTFSAHQDRMKRVELSPSANLLMSLVQHRTLKDAGKSVKLIIDVSQIHDENLPVLKKRLSEEDLQALLCASDRNIQIGSDYKPSVLRVNHYISGSPEQFAERRGDFRDSEFKQLFAPHHLNVSAINKDIDYWIDWFIKKVGMTMAEKILFKPLSRTNKELAHLNDVKVLKLDLIKMGILPKKIEFNAEMDEESEGEDY